MDYEHFVNICYKYISENLLTRLNDVLNKKSSELADVYNPFPPDRVAAMYKEIFTKTRKTAFDFYKSEGLSDRECAERTLAYLRVSF